MARKSTDFWNAFCTECKLPKALLLLGILTMAVAMGAPGQEGEKIVSSAVAYTLGITYIALHFLHIAENFLDLLGVCYYAYFAAKYAILVLFGP